MSSSPSAGTSSPNESQSEFVQPAHPANNIATTVPEDWIGYELDLSPPAVRHLGMVGMVGMVGESDVASGLAQLFGEGEPGEPPDLEAVSEVGPETMLWIEVNAVTGDVYELTMPRGDVYAIHEWMVEHDFDKPRGPGGELLPDDPSMGANAELPDVRHLESQLPGAGSLGIEPRTNHSWSNGADSRSRMAIADGFTASHFPFKTISYMDGGTYGCTGTIIGEKVLLTAAHCVWNTDLDELDQQNVYPRRDGNTSPHGSAQLGLFWINPDYLDESCGSPGEPCNMYDIAIIQLTDDLGNDVGAMGFAATNTTATVGYQIRMRGYPSCHADWADQRPASCSSKKLYGSGQDCDASNFHAGGYYSDNWYCEFKATCDGSAGQSGAAAYTYDISGFGGNPAALGVFSQMDCDGEECMGNATPNHFTRITPDQAALFSVAKSAWGSW